MDYALIYWTSLILFVICELSSTEISPLKYRGYTPLKPRWGRTYGGQLVAQSIVAAARTVGGADSVKPPNANAPSTSTSLLKGSSPFVVNSIQCNFLRGGDDRFTIEYHVEYLKNSGSFRSRLVRAFQKGTLLFIATVSFHLPEGESIAHQEPPPSLPGPECFPLGSEVCKHLAEDPSSGLSAVDRRILSKSAASYAPFDIKFASPEDNSSAMFRSSPPPPPAPPRRQCYVKTCHELFTFDGSETTLGSLSPSILDKTNTLTSIEIEEIRTAKSSIMRESGENTTTTTSSYHFGSGIDNTTAHAAALAYMSDWGMIDAATKPHRVGRFNPLLMPSSLTHSITFHAHDFRADEWLLVDIYSPVVRNSRAMLFSRFFTLNGVQIATCTQEALLRLRDPSKFKSPKGNTTVTKELKSSVPTTTTPQSHIQSRTTSGKVLHPSPLQSSI